MVIVHFKVICFCYNPEGTDHSKIGQNDIVMGTEKTIKTGARAAAFKFVPLLVFALLVILFKVDLLLAAPIATISPIIRNIVEKNVECTDEDAEYNLRLHLATFTSAMGIYGSELVPWHCFPVFFASIANAVYPLYTFSTIDTISRNYMSFIVVGSILLLTFTGWDRFIPYFGLPEDDRIKLRKGSTAKCSEA